MLKLETHAEADGADGVQWPRKDVYRLGWKVGEGSTIMVGGGEVCLAKWPN